MTTTNDSISAAGIAESREADQGPDDNTEERTGSQHDHPLLLHQLQSYSQCRQIQD